MKRIWFRCVYCCERHQLDLKHYKEKQSMRLGEPHELCFSYLCDACGEWFPVHTGYCHKNCKQKPCFIQVKDEVMRGPNGTSVTYYKDLLGFIYNESNISKYLRTVTQWQKYGRVRAHGNMHRALRILVEQGRARYNELRHTEWTNIELQKLLILGLAERVPKDCDLCHLRIQCIASNWKCLLRKQYLYAPTSLGRKALKILNQTPTFIPPGSKRMPDVEVEIELSEFWIEYSRSHHW